MWFRFKRHTTHSHRELIGALSAPSLLIKLAMQLEGDCFS